MIKETKLLFKGAFLVNKRNKWLWLKALICCLLGRVYRNENIPKKRWNAEEETIIWYDYYKTSTGGYNYQESWKQINVYTGLFKNWYVRIMSFTNE